MRCVRESSAGGDPGDRRSQSDTVLFVAFDDRVPLLLEGGGVRLFAGPYDRQELRLLDTTVRDTGIVEHQYEILG